MHAAVLAALLAALALAGCTSPDGLAGPPRGADSYRAMGFDGNAWPDLRGAKVTVLGYSSFSYVFGDLKAEFENLTNATVELVTEDDSGSVLERAVRERGNPSFDVVYGIDNVLYGKARREGVFEPYQPLLGGRIDGAYAFAPGWLATPVNHGYVAVNVDARANLTVQSLDDVRAHAGKFVTQDPRTSTPGLGFLLATVATYGEASPDRYDYLDYWRELLANGTLVTAGWTEAYAQHFTGGYGQSEEGFRGQRPIVTSYTTSPAYETYYGYDKLNGLVLAPRSTFHQVQLMGIAHGTRNLAAAQAWVEFCLTDAFQGRAASGEAVYPVVRGVGTAEVYGGKDPRPGTFEDAGFGWEHLDANVERWLREWTDVFERARAG